MTSRQLGREREPLGERACFSLYFELKSVVIDRRVDLQLHLSPELPVVGPADEAASTSPAQREHSSTSYRLAMMGASARLMAASVRWEPIASSSSAIVPTARAGVAASRRSRPLGARGPEGEGSPPSGLRLRRVCPPASDTRPRRRREGQRGRAAAADLEGRRRVGHADLLVNGDMIRGELGVDGLANVTEGIAPLDG